MISVNTILIGILATIVGAYLVATPRKKRYFENPNDGDWPMGV